MLEVIKSSLVMQLKLNVEIIEACKEKISNFLSSMKSPSIFLYRSSINIVKIFRSTSLCMSPLTRRNLSSQLSAIREEDEEEVIKISCENGIDLYSKMYEKDITQMDTHSSTSISYADMLKKRKLSENSTSDEEDSEFEFEN